ncbi:MAG: hemerythrin domain-containing protein [Silicimonas sp.]|nr:hemerythrin domain-containing protein [Silicimonas sp.]
MHDTDLETRTGLPEALRVLLQDYPREAWEADPAFSALIRFWLDRHLMFRKLLTTLKREAESALDGAIEDRVHGAHLSRYGRMLLQELHGHHTIEDQHYFPQIKVLDDRVGQGFDILDADHHAIDGHLQGFADEANGVLGAIGAGDAHRDAVARFRVGVIRLEGFLDRHLSDEEDLVVPILLKYAPSGLI